jgi:hypothetical protein
MSRDWSFFLEDGAVISASALLPTDFQMPRSAIQQPDFLQWR